MAVSNAENKQATPVDGAATGGATTISTPSDREIMMTRVLDAPRALIFEASTRPEHLRRWWGPRKMQMSVCEVDLRVGGAYRFVLLKPNGQEFGFHGVYQEIVPGERLVQTQVFEGMAGAESVVTVTFEDAGGKTLVTSKVLHKTREARDGHLHSMEPGASETFQRLAELLAEIQTRVATATNSEDDAMEKEVTITRVFDAEPEVVFRAWTEPEYLARWFGPKEFTNPVCEVDLRPGGAWWIVMRGPNGMDYPFGGVYREIVPFERLVFTNNAIDGDGKRLLEGLTTVLFAGQSGKTKLTLKTYAKGLVPYAPQMLKGMEAGWSQSLEKLESNLREGK